MLKIWVRPEVGDLPTEWVTNIKSYFLRNMRIEWFADPFVVRIIKEVDKTDVIPFRDSYIIDSPVFGIMPPERLSTGCKSLILLHKINMKLDGARLGDNCLGLLLEMAEEKDIEIALGHIPKFPEPFTALVINTNVYVHSVSEYITEEVNIYERAKDEWEDVIDV
jgi:hypothetical protein